MDGIPACANHKINNDYFRDTRGFAGFMVSDCDAVSDFISFPQVNITTDAQAAALGINYTVVFYGAGDLMREGYAFAAGVAAVAVAVVLFFLPRVLPSRAPSRDLPVPAEIGAPL